MSNRRWNGSAAKRVTCQSFAILAVGTQPTVDGPKQKRRSRQGKKPSRVLTVGIVSGVLKTRRVFRRSILLVGRGREVGICATLGGEAEHTIGRLAGLRGGGGDVASLGAKRVARTIPVRDRVILFPHADWVSDHTDPSAREACG